MNEPFLILNDSLYDLISQVSPSHLHLYFTQLNTGRQQYKIFYNWPILNDDLRSLGFETNDEITPGSIVKK